MFWCEGFSARITQVGCDANAGLAHTTFQSLNSGEETLFSLPDHAVQRMLVCGSCPRSGLPSGAVQQTFRRGADRLITKITNFDEWGSDPELSRIRTSERGKQWREAHAPQIAAAGKRRRRESRLQYLQSKYRR